MNSKKYIYALVYDEYPSAQSLQEGPDEIAFYIGSTQNPSRRHKEHRYASRTGHEDKYQFIRELEKQGKEWDLKELHTVEEDDNRPWEYWYVIDYIRKGSPLKNMRYGNLNKISENRLRQLADDKSVDSIDILQKKLVDEPKKADYSASENTQMRAILKSLRFLRVDKDDSGRNWNIYDLGDGTDEIKADYYMKKKTIAVLLLPDTIKMLNDMQRDLEERHPLPK